MVRCRIPPSVGMPSNSKVQQCFLTEVMHPDWSNNREDLWFNKNVKRNQSSPHLDCRLDWWQHSFPTSLDQNSDSNNDMPPLPQWITFFVVVCHLVTYGLEHDNKLGIDQYAVVRSCDMTCVISGYGDHCHHDDQNDYISASLCLFGTALWRARTQQRKSEGKIPTTKVATVITTVKDLSVLTTVTVIVISWRWPLVPAA